MKFRLRWALAVLSLLLVLPAAPVHASSSSNDGDLGSGGTPGGGSEYTYWCQGQARVRQKVVGGVRTGPIEIWDAMSPRCISSIGRPEYVGDGPPGSFSGFSLCPNGIEVWRFWGTDANPILGWSVSRVNVDRATRTTCSQNQPGNRFSFTSFIAHPDDARNGAVSAGVTPTYRPASVNSGEYGSAWDWSVYPGQAGRVVNAYAETTPQVRCQSYLNIRADGLVALSPIFGCFPGGSSFTPLPPFRQGGQPCTVIGADKELDPDRLPCSSGSDFIQSGEGGYTTYVGACWAQTVHIGPTYNREGVHSESEIGAAQKYGLRYEALFSDHASGYYNRGDAVAPAIAAAWREQIRNEIATRGNEYETNSPARTFSDRNWRNKTGFLRATAGSDADRAQGAVSVARDASCQIAKYDPQPVVCPPGTEGCPPPSCPDGSPDCTGGGDTVIDDFTANGINITVTAPDVAQVGYTSTGSRQARVTATPGSMLCDGGPCDPGKVRLDTLTFNLEVVAPAGYRQCAPGQVTRCDYRVTLEPQRTSPRQQGQVWAAEFYGPTPPSSSFQVRLTGVSATYRAFIVESYTYVDYVWNKETLEFEQVTRSITNKYWSEPRPLPVAVAGAPDSFQVIGATSRPR